VSDTGGIPSVADMKDALCTYGPVAVAVTVTPAFQMYNSGVFDEDDSGNVNHGITVIGWDDSKTHALGSGAWLIKNSWGTHWGETGGYGADRGYMWIAYGSNQVGFGAAWAEAPDCHLTLTIEDTDLDVGEQTNASATVRHGNVLAEGVTVDFTSDNPTIAFVLPVSDDSDDQGKAETVITGGIKGETWITASAEGLSAKEEVKVPAMSVIALIVVALLLIGVVLWRQRAFGN
jgi:hypothetical protein